MKPPVSEFRRLASAQNPFLLGGNPDRPSPTHVLNGFVAASIGVSTKAAALRRLVASDEEPPEDFDFLTQSAWARSPSTLAAFRNDLSLIFNPNRRMWKDIGSPVPVHGLLTTSDPSDDGFGPLLWSLIRSRVTEEQVVALRQLLSPEDARDPVSNCALILCKDASSGTPRGAPSSGSEWFSENGSHASRFLADQLASFVFALVRPYEDARRLAQLQHLGRAAYLATVLALLLGPIAAARTDVVTSVDEIAPLVVWAGMPPGTQHHPIVMAAARSLQTTIEAHRTQAADGLRSALEGQTLPNDLPVRQRRRAALRAQLISSGLDAGRVDATLETLKTRGEISVDGEAVASERWIQRLVAGAYPSDHVTRGFRAMGWKLGFIGPDRGSGTPRFVCETPLLATIVEGLCPPEGMDFELFVDEARTKLGLVLGLGTEDQLGERLGLWEGAGIARRLLRDNQEELRQRLLRSGLAREYSDSHTEVVPHA